MAQYFDGKEVVYHHFPLDYPWNFWKYAISDDGKIAWVDPDTWRLYISDGKSEIALPEDQITNDCFAWLNNTTLIYLRNGDGSYQDIASSYPLMMYHIDTGISEQVRTVDGTPVLLHNMTNDVAVDPTGRYLAYIQYYEDAWGTTQRIAVLSLENGEVYTVPGEKLGIGEYTAIGGYDNAYVPQLEWVPEEQE